MTVRKAIVATSVILGILLIGAAVLFLAAGGESGASPRIMVDRQVIDFGYTRLGEPVAFSITVTNTGEGPLKFLDPPYIEVLEGC